MTDPQDGEAPARPRARRQRRSPQGSAIGGTRGEEPQLLPSAATMRLFEAGRDDYDSDNGDGGGGGGGGGESEGEEPTGGGGPADKLSGKNPRWLAVQGKQRQADSVRERIQRLTESIEAEEAKPEPALKKSWLLAKRQELRKIVLKQPEDIIDGEGFVDKVERKLAAARDSRTKATKKAKGKKKAKPGDSNSDSETDANKDDASAQDLENGGDHGNASDADKETQAGGSKAERSSEGAGPRDSGDQEKDDAEQLAQRRIAKLNKLFDTTGAQSSQDEEQAQDGQANGRRDKTDRRDKAVKKKPDEAESDRESAASDQSEAEAEVEEGVKSAKDAKGKKGKLAGKERDRKKDEDATKEKKEKEKEKKREKEKKKGNVEEKDKPDRKSKGKAKKGEKQRDRRDSDSETERSESENEGAKPKWKRPLKKMEAVIKLPSRKKRVEKIPRGGSTADRQDNDSVDGSGSGSDSLWGERIDTPKDAAARPKRRLSASSRDRPPSSADEDAAAVLSDDDGVDKVKLKELPTSGKRHDRQKQKKKAEAQSARKGSVIAEIPVLQDSMRQKLRDKFTIKRKPKRSTDGDGAAGDDQGDVGKDGKGGWKDKKKQKEKAKEKQQGSKLDEVDGEAKKATRAASKLSRAGGDSDSDNLGGSRTWRGSAAAAGAAPRSPMRCRIDDTMHCISLDD